MVSKLGYPCLGIRDEADYYTEVLVDVPASFSTFCFSFLTLRYFGKQIKFQLHTHGNHRYIVYIIWESMPQNILLDD